MNDTAVQRVMNLFGRTAWIITATDGHVQGGLVATFVNSASLVPAMPRLTIGIARHHHTWGLIDRSRCFAAHLVDEAEPGLIWRFGLGSGRDVDKLADLSWHRGRTGSPILDAAMAWLDCAIEAELDIGDRSIYVAAVVDGDLVKPGPPMSVERLLQLGSEEQLRRMQDERLRDERLDAEAMAAWRKQRGIPWPR
jgi:flavin reductase (DIM6/NTAB) family NADH-FMN oxidoreductase RutF